MPAHLPASLRGTRVTVMGLGRFGGGSGVVRWLCAQGADVRLTDRATADELRDPLRELDDLVAEGAVTLALGGHREEDFTGADLVVASPAVPRPWENRYLVAATRAGVPLTTEIRLATEQLPRARTIGVTGTAGKSTTAAMIAHVLRAAGVPARLGGNIGGSLLVDAASIGPEEWIVIELSSFMLHWLAEGAGATAVPGWSPHIGLLTNLAPNHLDWHGSFEHYAASKQRLFAAMTEDDHAVHGDAIPLPDPPIELAVPGLHNQRNAAQALEVVARAVAVDPAIAATALRAFPGLPHRLELVAEHDGRRFYNDSKSTTPEATVLAVEACGEPSRVHLIAGGHDKGADLHPLVELAERLGGLYAIGRTAPALGADPSVHRCETLDRAVETALPRLRRGDVLLLSPGCASWDQFVNYTVRGERFRTLVREALGLAANSGDLDQSS